MTTLAPITMTLLESTIASLRAREANLRMDFEVWRRLTSPDAELRQHNSQVERITDVLGGTLSESLPDTQFDTATLNRVADLRRAIGSIHFLWDYFRDKFAQRTALAFENHLGAADDLAWACYKPCLEAAVAAGTVDRAAVKEPPLVFYSTDRAPFASARTKTFHPPGLDFMDVKAFRRVLMRLPIPVIGIPWPVANRLPELVLVGHEVGHVVAEDLGLADEATQTLAAIPYPNDPGGARNNVWRNWSDEVFGDIFGVCATGRAYLSGLAAEFAAGVNNVRFLPIDEQSPGAYPTPTLRMAICESVLRAMGITPSTTWSDNYGSLIGESAEFKADVDPVAEAIVHRKWNALGGRKLGESLPWSQEQEDQADSLARSQLSESPSAVAFNVRVAVAASMKAAEKDPAAYARLGLDEKLARIIVNRRDDGLRSEESFSLRAEANLLEAFGPGDRVATRAALRAADEQAGRNIARSMTLNF